MWSRKQTEERNLNLRTVGTSLAVQWLRLHASIAGGVGSIPGHGTKIPSCCVAKKKEKKLKDYSLFIWNLHKRQLDSMAIRHSQKLEINQFFSFTNFV